MVSPKSLLWYENYSIENNLHRKRCGTCVIIIIIIIIISLLKSYWLQALFSERSLPGSHTPRHRTHTPAQHRHTKMHIHTKSVHGSKLLEVFHPKLITKKYLSTPADLTIHTELLWGCDVASYTPTHTHTHTNASALQGGRHLELSKYRSWNTALGRR